MKILFCCLSALFCAFVIVSSAYSDESILGLCDEYAMGEGPHVGVYHGEFYPHGRRMKHTLVVLEETATGNVVARWAHGKQSKWGITKEGCHWVAGKYAENKIEVVAHGSKVIYTFNADGKVKAVFIQGDGVRVKGKLTKANNN